MRGRTTCTVLFACALLPGAALAQMYVYPEKGQSAEQQQRDQGECHSWAVQQSGFNPGAPQVSGAPQGGAVRGAARGAAAGAVVGAITGDAGKGAAAGAAGGALLGAMRRRDQQREQQAQTRQGMDGYNRAFSACMQGRGYSVN